MRFYYWVRRIGDDKWQIAEWYPSTAEWYLCGIETPLQGSSFEEIGQYIRNPYNRG